MQTELDAAQSADLHCLRFAVIGDHPDGLAMARALVETGHVLALYAGPPRGAEQLRQWNTTLEVVTDVEQTLAGRDIDIVIVADDVAHRPDVLRRAVQSELHVLCVHPVDLKPDVAYEAAMILNDTRKVLLPILPERFTSGFVRLQQLCNEGMLGRIQLIEMEVGLESGRGDDDWEGRPLLSLWDILRVLGGEIEEVSAMSGGAETLQPQDVVNLSGRFAAGGLFQAMLTRGHAGIYPSATEGRRRLLVRGDKGQVTLLYRPNGSEPSELTCSTDTGHHTEHIEAGDPWLVLADTFNRSISGRPVSFSWVDGIRCLELFDAVRTSVERRRVVPMYYYDDFSEEASFKGLMASFGCGLLWLALMLLIAAVWIPWMAYLILPLLLLFLALQSFHRVFRSGNDRRVARPESAKGVANKT